MLTIALYTIAKTWKQSKQSSINKEMKITWYIYTMECLSAIKELRMTFIATWIDLGIIILTKGK